MAGEGRVRRNAVFTVDVEGDWAGSGTRGIREALPRLIELLDGHGATATFFVVGAVAELVRGIVDPAGRHEVGSHSLTHPDLRKVPPWQVLREIEESKQRLEAAGYAVDGFRAPYFGRPEGLGGALAAAGYRYDASVGAVHPFRRRAATTTAAAEPLPIVPVGRLRDGRTPFGLTFLRLTHPASRWLVGADPGTFYCHPHELVGASRGWTKLPWGLRQLHRRNAGATAWTIVERLLARPDLRFVSCRDHLASLTAESTPAPAAPSDLSEDRDIAAGGNAPGDHGAARAAADRGSPDDPGGERHMLAGGNAPGGRVARGHVTDRYAVASGSAPGDHDAARAAADRGDPGGQAVESHRAAGRDDASGGGPGGQVTNGHRAAGREEAGGGGSAGTDAPAA